MPEQLNRWIYPLPYVTPHALEISDWSIRRVSTSVSSISLLKIWVVKALNLREYQQSIRFREVMRPDWKKMTNNLITCGWAVRRHIFSDLVLLLNDISDTEYEKSFLTSWDTTSCSRKRQFGMWFRKWKTCSDNSERYVAMIRNFRLFRVSRLSSECKTHFFNKKGQQVTLQ